MKFKISIMLFLLLASFTKSQQYDLTVKLNETEINKLFSALVYARGINFGDYYGTYGLSNWFVNVDNASIDILPNQQAKINMSISCAARLNLLLISPVVVTHASGAIWGSFVLQGNQQTGFKFIFQPTHTNLTSWGDLPDPADDIINILINNIDVYPDIELNLGTEILPQSNGLFTEDLPVFSTNDTEAVLGFYFTGPRMVTLQNDFDGDKTIGTIDVFNEEIGNGVWQSYDSPARFYWARNSSHLIRAMDHLVPFNSINWKFYNWDGGGEPVPIQKEILVSRDLEFTAYFEPVFPLSLQLNLPKVDRVPEKCYTG